MNTLCSTLKISSLKVIAGAMATDLLSKLYRQDATDAEDMPTSSEEQFCKNSDPDFKGMFLTWITYF